MRRALISDVHANLEALTAVLEHIRHQNVEEIWCLGDIIGYGPDPVGCLDTVMANCSLTILGNHDQAAIFDPEGFNPIALNAIYWTREQLEKNIGGVEATHRRWDYLGELPRRHDEGAMLYVHGSPRDPTNEYVFPQHAYEEERMEPLFRRFESTCFQGHTHLPGVFLESCRFLAPEHVEGVFKLSDEKAMINVGSVGQPRDEDPRACYVVLDTGRQLVEFHRVEYDFQSTKRKIYAIPELDNMLGDRLEFGD